MYVQTFRMSYPCQRTADVSPLALVSSQLYRFKPFSQQFPVRTNVGRLGSQWTVHTLQYS